MDEDSTRGGEEELDDKLRGDTIAPEGQNEGVKGVADCNISNALTMDRKISILREQEQPQKQQPQRLQQHEQRFGHFVIDESQIFFRSPAKLSCAIVNLRPIVPGHVLVIATRVAPKLSDLSGEEYDDLWRTVRLVQGAIERQYGASACNVAVQDGVAAGQSVPHVHVHILPRIDGDFKENDDVYDELEKWDPTEKNSAPVPEFRNKKLQIPEHRKDRSEEEMREEAQRLRNVMMKSNDEEQGIKKANLK